ncbi:MAG: hypothetical protein DMD74_11720 [Gemmatimonadetes bacterium]|nr:MAG: hypothetical protein DMD74_11720 [Gemmatimonadota bacterium]
MKAVSLGSLLALSGVVLMACSDASVSGPDNTITVSGTVVDEYLRPQVSVGVLIEGRPLVLTDANGHFTISAVRAPYTLVTGLTSERAALIYAGLTRTDPLVVVPPDPLLSPFRGAYVWGDVYGGTGLPEPANHRTSVLFESHETRWPGPAGVDHYTLQPQWLGPETTVGTLHALQWQFDPTSGLPVAYKGYGNTPLTLSNGGYSQGPPVTMAATVPAGSISGSVAVPDGFAVSARILRAGFETSSARPPAWMILTDSGGANSFTYVTPDLPGAMFSLTARAVAGQAYTEVLRTGIGANAAAITLSIPAAPVLIAPENGASGVNSRTEYRWSRMTGAVYLLAIFYSGAEIYIPPPPSYYIFTSDTIASIPDLSPFGLYSYSGTPHVWEVRAWAPFRSLDEIAAATWFVPQGDGVSAVSAPRQFTVAR